MLDAIFTLHFNELCIWSTVVNSIVVIITTDWMLVGMVGQELTVRKYRFSKISFHTNNRPDLSLTVYYTGVLFSLGNVLLLLFIAIIQFINHDNIVRALYLYDVQYSRYRE